jgi:hypothetical protein
MCSPKSNDTWSAAKRHGVGVLLGDHDAEGPLALGPRRKCQSVSASKPLMANGCVTVYKSVLCYYDHYYYY